MAKKNLRIVRITPGIEPVKKTIDRLVKEGSGWITAFNDSRLRVLADLVPPDCGVEIVPFGALVAHILLRMSETVHQLPQRGLVQAAVAEACSALDGTSPFYKTQQFRGLHARLAETLDDLRSWGLSPDSLDQIVPLCQEGTANKLRSLASLEREVRAILSDLGRTFNSENIETFLNSDVDEEFSIPELVVMAGSDYSPLQAQWLKKISESASGVTVFVEGHDDPALLFEDASLLTTELKTKPETSPNPRKWLDSVFTDKPATGDIPAITIQSASDPLAEVEWALRDCLAIKATGIDWSDMGIFVRDVETYGPLIQVASRRLGVPTQIARRGPILENGYARLILQALTFLSSNDIRTIAPLLKSSYIDVERSLAIQLASVTKELSRDKNTQWSELLQWSVHHEEEYPWLRALLEWRKLAVSEPVSMAIWVERLRRLPEGQSWLDRSNDTGAHVSRDARIHTALQRALTPTASIRRVRRDIPMSLVQFVREAKENWSEADCSIPPSNDGIRVFSQSEALLELHSLHVLGMLEGVFPRRRSEDPILTDEEREEISTHLKVAPLPDSRRRARSERDHFFRICACAKSALVFSYPLTGDDRDNVPAFYLDELARVAGDRIHRKDFPRTQWAPSPTESISYSDMEMAQALVAERDLGMEESFESNSAASIAKPNPNESLKPRQLRDAFECPFRFFARYRLGLYGNRTGHLWSRLYDLPGNVSLATIPTREAAVSQLRQALESELDSVIVDVDEWEIGVVRAGGERLIDEWVEREFAARAKWPADPGTLKTNVPFGEGGLKGSLMTLTGDRVVLEGRLASLSQHMNVSVGHIYRRSQFRVGEGKNFELDGDTLELGTYLAAIFERGKGAALDVESMSEKRLVYITDFDNPLSKFDSDKNAGLEVKPLGPPHVFFEQIKHGLGQAMTSITKAKINATPGDHCRRCDMGELCRKSSEFSEEESPFGDE